MLLTICLLIGITLPVALGKCGTCTLSGDQHFITLDGAEHHYYGRGWHRLYQLDRFEVQCLFADCKTGKETIDGHRRRNDGRRICLQACRAQFTPPDDICPQVVNWEPLQVNDGGQSVIEVNGARLVAGKGIAQADKDQTWWIRMERVGKDAVAIDIMMGSGVGGLALRLGPKRIVTVNVRGLQGGRGLCGSCDASTTNDLGGVSRLNISDIEGHNRFADAHRRGAPGFALIPKKPECAGGHPVPEDQEVDKLLKDAESERQREESVYKGNKKMLEMGSEVVRPGDPDHDPMQIVPPVAVFTNETLLQSTIQACQAGMMLSPNDDRMKFSIDNCVLDKARGRGFELAAASNIVAYVQALMVDEQAELAVQKMAESRNFCAMCQSAIQTFVVDSKPILRHTIEKQAHCFDKGVAFYSALAPAPFEVIDPDPTPSPTKKSSTVPGMTSVIAQMQPGLPPQMNGLVPPMNGVVPQMAFATPLPPNSSMMSTPPKLSVTSKDPPTGNATVMTSLGPKASENSSASTGDKDAKHPTKDGPAKKPKSKADSDTPKKYHLKGGKVVSNEDDDEDDDDDDDDDNDDDDDDDAKDDDESSDKPKRQKDKSKKETKSAKPKDKEKKGGAADKDDDDDVKTKPKREPSPESKSAAEPLLSALASAASMTRAPILPGASPDPIIEPSLINNRIPNATDTVTEPNKLAHGKENEPTGVNSSYPIIKATPVRV